MSKKLITLLLTTITLTVSAQPTISNAKLRQLNKSMNNFSTACVKDNEEFAKQDLKKAQILCDCLANELVLQGDGDFLEEIVKSNDLDNYLLRGKVVKASFACKEKVGNLLK